jgi:hypothetical protein
MGPVSGEPVKVKRQGCDERLSFTRLHLGDLALVEHDPAEDLHVEVAQADTALGYLADGGEGLGQDVIERLPAGQTLAEVG